MASNSPAFVPPLDRLIEDDPQIVKVAMDVVEIGFRKSQQGKTNLADNTMTIKHVDGK